LPERLDVEAKPKVREQREVRPEIIEQTINLLAQRYERVIATCLPTPSTLPAFDLVPPF
jgi:hypothetical protein